MIIDTTDFVNRPCKVPNQEESRDFISFLETQEEEYGKMLLGYPLWEEFKAGLVTSGTIEQRWLDLKNGAEYEYSSKVYKYTGWVDMIKRAIMHDWVPLTTWKLTNIGFVENNAPQQSKLIDDPYPLMVEHWNEFVKKVGGNHNFAYNCKESFYGFMKANESDYDGWRFTCPHFKNRHDL